MSRGPAPAEVQREILSALGRELLRSFDYDPAIEISRVPLARRLRSTRVICAIFFHNATITIQSEVHVAPRARGIPFDFYIYEGANSHPEKSCCAAALECAVLDLRLLGEIFGALDRGIHPLDGEESRQISRIRGDHDQREEPPHTGDHACRHGPTTSVRRLQTGFPLALVRDS